MSTTEKVQVKVVLNVDTMTQARALFFDLEQRCDLVKYNANTILTYTYE